MQESTTLIWIMEVDFDLLVEIDELLQIESSVLPASEDDLLPTLKGQ
jgi:hypothetical protein